MWIGALVVALGMVVHCVMEDWGQDLMVEKRRLCR
jgi:hypothetical protein